MKTALFLRKVDQDRALRPITVVAKGNHVLKCGSHGLKLHAADVVPSNFPYFGSRTFTKLLRALNEQTAQTEDFVQQVNALLKER